MSKIRRALISVSDKTGVVEFARALAEMGVELLSTGGTARALREAGLHVTDVAEVTGFPEMLDGRVKTLHPRIHGGILYVRGRPEHEQAVTQHGLAPVDLVCVNLYPFESVTARPGTTWEEAIENIDIGGPAMVRSAAKNMEFVTVVTDPADYSRVVACMRENGGATTLELRRELGAKAFARTAQYDAAIAAWLAARVSASEGAPWVAVGRSRRRLRYGENPHQAGWLCEDPSDSDLSLVRARQLHGKEMSYNNYLDGEAALETVREFSDPAAVVIKHNNPCGCATALSLADALEAAWDGDPVSAFGSVIAVNRRVDLATAERLKGRFVEALIAPEFEPDALEFLQKKSRDIRLLELEGPVQSPKPGLHARQIRGGWLLQERDVEILQHWVVPTSAPFPDEKRPLAEFGIRVVKHVKSNAIVIVHEHRPGCFALLGMGAGQPNRVDALRRLAIPRAVDNLQRWYAAGGDYGISQAEYVRRRLSEAVLVSDAFFPFPDNIEAAAEAGIRFIVQPGGSVRDEEVIAACDRYGVAMVFTGRRHFLH